MNFIKKNILILSILGLFAAGTKLKADDAVTIINPIAQEFGTVSGNPLSINGSSSEANFTIRLYLNTNYIGSTVTDESGNWSYTVPGYLNNGSYQLEAWLINASFSILATNTITFMIDNGNWLIVTSPQEAQIISFDPVNFSGQSSLPDATIKISLDGNQIATTTTDSNGNWGYTYTMTSANGIHTFFVELISGDVTVASGTVNVITNIPFVLPPGTSQIRFIDGNVPTSGSGSGVGYTYSVSGSTMTVNFVPVFSATPSMIATGLRTAGSSTVSLTSISATAATIAFSTGTQRIHFSASALQ
jgi:large repetitive protein